MTTNWDFIARPGPTRQQPVTLSFRRSTPDQEGARGGIECDLSIVEARAIAHDILQACEWAEEGKWKPRTPIVAKQVA